MSFPVISFNFSRFLSFFLLLQLFCSSASKMVDIDEETSVFNNSVYGDNDLWHTLYDKCGRSTSFRCVQDGMYAFLDRTLESDLFVTDAVSFTQNSNNYTEICRRVKKDDPGDYNERLARKLHSQEDDGFSDFVEKVEGVERLESDRHRKGKSLNDSKNAGSTLTGEESNGVDKLESDSANKVNTVDSTTSETPSSEKEADPILVESPKNIRDVSDILYDRGVKYLMTHDMELSVPSFVFGGARVKISPRGFDEDGGALVKLNVFPDHSQQEGRLFLKHLQKIFKKKLMTSMLAAMLILKLLKLKAMFFLPLLLGVGTAKKILLKVLLFLFPALAHLFKLCSYYHHKHAKYHHHHHQIAHHHHHIPVPVYTPVHSGPGELPAPYPASYDSSGPGSASLYSHSRTETPGSLADLAAWGLGEYPAAWDSPGGSALGANSISATDPPRYTYPTRAQQQVGSTLQYPSQADLKRFYATASKTSPQYAQALTARFQALTPRPTSAQGIYSQGGYSPGAYDTFYSPMLIRLDAVFGQLGVQEEGCKERLVCSMYKNPARFSPHSNLVSAELSRDPSELQKPQSANSAVVRFYRYIQAARDGQELKDCLRLYAACTLSTE